MNEQEKASVELRVSLPAEVFAEYEAAAQTFGVPVEKMVGGLLASRRGDPLGVRHAVIDGLLQFENLGAGPTLVDTPLWVFDSVFFAMIDAGVDCARSRLFGGTAPTAETFECSVELDPPQSAEAVHSAASAAESAAEQIRKLLDRGR